MIKKEIEIVVDTKNAKTETENLTDSMNRLAAASEEANKKASKASEEAAEKAALAAKKLQKENTLVAKGTRAIGKAFKAIGIGVVVALLAFLTKAFSRNQKFADALGTSLEAISLVFTQFVNSVIKTVEQVSKATNGFQSLRDLITNLITVAISPLKLGFLGIKLGVQEAQLAWEKSFFGDDDPKTVKELNERIKETKLNILEVGKDAIKSGKDVGKNIVGAIVDVVNVTTIASKNLKDISISSAIEQAKVTTQLKNTAELAAASIQGLIEKYDREAELLRAIRDDDRKSIAERIQANDDLAAKLDEQETAQKRLANENLKLAKQNLKGNEDNIAFKTAEIEALNEIAAIEATVTGFRAEQLTNRNALDKERIELLRSFNEIGKNDLELAKSEAEQVREDRLIQIELQVEDEVEKNRLLAAAKADFNKTIADLDSEEAIRVAAAIAETDKKNKEAADAAAKIVELESSAKIAATDSYVMAAQAASNLLGRETAAGKALAVATTLASTYTSAQKAYESQLTIPTPDAPVRAAIAAGVAIATGLANVKQILAVKVAGQSGGGGANGAQGGRQASPAFNLTGRSNVNQLQTGIDEQETSPVRAFVVSQDMTTQQSADRATRSQASFG
jgi:hypothetical protein